MATRQETLERVRATVHDILGESDVRVYLFGSWATGSPSRTSDIDIGVLPEGDLPPGMLARLREALSEIPVPYPVEVVDLRDTNPDFRRRVLREGLPWSA